MQMSQPDFMERAFDLAQRAIGSTAPNPIVGCVLVRDGSIVGEGYHHAAGSPHAEVEALAMAGELARGATAYVTLEPCNHHGRTPPCARALVKAGVAHVVVGTVDPNPATHGDGIGTLRAAGITVELLNSERARRLIEIFAHGLTSERPYMALKMAMSMDGYISAKAAQQLTLTSLAWGSAVRNLRIEHDAVLVGAGTVRVDDPQLTVRPAHERVRPYRRIVACESNTVPEQARVFDNVDGYEKTIVLAPAGLADRFANLQNSADLLLVGDSSSMQLDLAAGLRALRIERDVHSVLCEGGPTLGARMIAAGLVDRFYWAMAPRLLANVEAVPVLAGENLAELGLRAHFDSCELIGDDVVVSGRLQHV